MVGYKFNNGDVVAVNQNNILSSNDVKNLLTTLDSNELYVMRVDTGTYSCGKKIKDNGEVYDFVKDGEGFLLKFYETDLKLVEHSKLNYTPNDVSILVINKDIKNYNLQEGYKIGKVVITSEYYYTELNKGDHIIFDINKALSIEIDGVTYHQVEISEIKGVIS